MSHLAKIKLSGQWEHIGVWFRSQLNLFLALFTRPTQVRLRQIRIRNKMWQSHVEIEGYSIAYFDRIAVFEAPYH